MKRYSSAAPAEGCLLNFPKIDTSAALPGRAWGASALRADESIVMSTPRTSTPGWPCGRHGRRAPHTVRRSRPFRTQACNTSRLPGGTRQ
jgi:hypothetical protein